MKSAFTTVAAAGVLALATALPTHEAQAQCRGCGVGLGLGLLGGLAAGAIIGSAAARAEYPGYAVAPGYAPYGAYAAPAPVACPGGYWARRPVIDAYGNVVGYSRPRFFCP